MKSDGNSATAGNTRGIYFSDRMEEALDGIFQCPLTVVEAPMGYGKTTAVRESLNKASCRVLWQRLYDPSVTVFWHQFSQLFREVGIEQAESLQALGFPDDGLCWHEALDIIESMDFSQRTVLVIDDYHIGECEQLNRFIEFLAGSEVEGLHLVLTTRFMKMDNTAELQLKRRLHFISKDTFELRPDEIMEYYRLCGIRIREEEAVRLHRFTEGWISALYLMMLGYASEGRMQSATNIYSLLESAVYLQLPEDAQELLLAVSVFDGVTSEAAAHLWGRSDAEAVLENIAARNAFVKFDPVTRQYQIHNLFTNYLKEVLERKPESFRNEMRQRAAHWHWKHGNRLEAMQGFYQAQDFDSLLCVLIEDKGNSMDGHQKDFLIRCYEECPTAVRHMHPEAILTYGMCMVTFNEFQRFEAACGEFLEAVGAMGESEPERVSQLMGEFHLLLCFTGYNDILKMTEHLQTACQLVSKPVEFLDTQGGWTFGSPSVLYMFHRETGHLDQAVKNLEVSMPLYYQLTGNHGKGAEWVMAAEQQYYRGDYVNAGILGHKALHTAESHGQEEIVVAALFLLLRLAVAGGDSEDVKRIRAVLHDEIKRKRIYMLIHTVDLCEGFMAGVQRQPERVPEWIRNGEFNSSRLFFQAMAFSNIIHGRSLLISGQHIKLLGLAEEFIGVASVFPNLLGIVYTHIYQAAANEILYRKEVALEHLRTALDLALPDQLYMAFVENGDYIKPLLEAVGAEPDYRDGVARILKLYKPYEASLAALKGDVVVRLSARELEIARMAAAGLNNREIGEQLFISGNTVKTQMKSVFEKLSINSRALLGQALEVYEQRSSTVRKS